MIASASLPTRSKPRLITLDQSTPVGVFCPAAGTPKIARINSRLMISPDAGRIHVEEEKGDAPKSVAEGAFGLFYSVSNETMDTGNPGNKPRNAIGERRIDGMVAHTVFANELYSGPFQYSRDASPSSAANRSAIRFKVSDCFARHSGFDSKPRLRPPENGTRRPTLRPRSYGSHR